MNQSSMLSTGLAAKSLGVSVGTVQKLVDVGLLHGGKTLGGHRRISRASLDAYQRRAFPFVEEGAAAPRNVADGPRRWRCAVASAQLSSVLVEPMERSVFGKLCVLEPLDSLVRLAIAPFDMLFLDARLGWLSWPEVCELADERGVFVVFFNHSEFEKASGAVALPVNMGLPSVWAYCAGYFHADR